MTNTKQDIIKGKKILVIEDDQYISRVYTKWLNKYGAEVTTANNGALALELLPKGNIDLVLLDLGMPGLNGVETLKMMRSNSKTKDMPVLVISNTTMTEDRAGFQELIDAGVSDILRKYEVSLEDLVEAIRKCLSEPSRHVSKVT